MKRFLFLFVPIVVFALVLTLSQVSLSEIFKGKSKGYEASDLGFVLEEKSPEGFVFYKSNGIVKGECMWLDGGRERLNEITDKLGMTINKKYMVEDSFIIEGFSPRIKFFNVNSQNNIQIAVRGDEIVVASPIIYGSY